MSRSKVKGQRYHGQKMGFSADIFRNAELICDKFIWKTCLVPCWDEFEDQGQRSMIKVTRDKTAFSALSAACVRFMFGKTF